MRWTTKYLTPGICFKFFSDQRSVKFVIGIEPIGNWLMVYYLTLGDKSCNVNTFHCPKDQEVHVVEELYR